MSAVKKLDVTVNLWQGEAVRHKERLRDRMKGGGGGGRPETFAFMQEWEMVI